MTRRQADQDSQNPDAEDGKQTPQHRPGPGALGVFISFIAVVLIAAGLGLLLNRHRAAQKEAQRVSKPDKESDEQPTDEKKEDEKKNEKKKREAEKKEDEKKKDQKRKDKRKEKDRAKQNPEQQPKPNQPPAEEPDTKPKNKHADSTATEEQTETNKPQSPPQPDQATKKPEHPNQHENPSETPTKPNPPKNSAQAANAKSAAPPTNATASGEEAVPISAAEGHRYDVKFSSDQALAQCVSRGNVWAWACPKDGDELMLVTPAVGAKPASADISNKPCTAEVRRQKQLHSLEYPTKGLVKALQIDANGANWWLELDERTMVPRVTAALQKAGKIEEKSGEKPLVIIQEDCSVRLGSST